MLHHVVQNAARWLGALLENRAQQNTVRATRGDHGIGCAHCDIEWLFAQHMNSALCRRDCCRRVERMWRGDNYRSDVTAIQQFNSVFFDRTIEFLRDVISDLAIAIGDGNQARLVDLGEQRGVLRAHTAHANDAETDRRAH